MLLRLFSWFPCHRFSCHSAGDMLLSIWCVVSAVPLLLNFQQKVFTSLLSQRGSTSFRVWKTVKPLFQSGGEVTGEREEKPCLQINENSKLKNVYLFS